MFDVIGLFLFAQQTPNYMDPATFGMNVLATVVFGVVGILLAIAGFKMFDLVTPGKLDEEIIQKQNLAAAIMGGAIIIGICLIVSRAVGG